MKVEERIGQENEALIGEKIKEFGITPRALDWKNEKDQQTRFRQIGTLFGNKEAFSVNDLGCGFGDFSEYLQKEFGTKAVYQGYDLVPFVVEIARQQHPHAYFQSITSAHEMSIADYTVASGIFNRTFAQVTEEEWWDYILFTIRHMFEKSRLGIAFNALTSYSDKERMREDLYYCDPCKLFDHCKRHLSRNVALLHDYDLYDFTLLVRKHP